EDCADDVAALATVLGVRRFVAVGYSMGGMIAQLLARRHPPLLSGLVLCSTAGNVRQAPAGGVAGAGAPPIAAAPRRKSPGPRGGGAGWRRRRRPGGPAGG